MKQFTTCCKKSIEAIALKKTSPFERSPNQVFGFAKFFELKNCKALYQYQLFR
ncbi:hypothetical protein [Scytonema sp. PCC 10023]|uniref:hypothetical protein n=1 Tax=Scytonema sp. PCC 10023 TaxID=1680591 RepID=UPI0039C66DBC